MARDTLCARYVKVSHVRRLAHESAMDLVAPGIEDVRAAYKKQENSRGVGWPRRGKEGKKRRSTLVAYIFYGAITSNPYLRFVQFCPSVQPSLFLTFSSSPLLTAYCFLPGWPSRRALSKDLRTITNKRGVHHRLPRGYVFDSNTRRNFFHPCSRVGTENSFPREIACATVSSDQEAKYGSMGLWYNGELFLWRFFVFILYIYIYVSMLLIP